jgi:RNA polymerase sigma-70 factor, ECF subfamily
LSGIIAGERALMATDEQLMVQFQQGRREAFEELFERYRNPIYGFFRRRLNDVGRAEDMAQETFIIILRGTERYEPRAKFRTYLYAVALKLLWTERRSELRQARLAAELVELQRENDPGTAIWIRDALARLDPDHREILMLREYEQLSYDEIAEVLEVPANTVRSRLFRARAQIKAFLQPQTASEASR